MSIATLEGSGLIPAGSKLALVDGRLEMVNSDILGGNTRVHPLTVPLTPDSLQELKSYDTSVWKLEGIAGTVLHLSPWG